MCAVSTVGGYELREIAGASLQGGIDGFAAGALLVMLVGSMIPEATEKARQQPGSLTIRTRFLDYTGRFVMHCHILFHEDHGMMQQLEVIDPPRP